MSFEQLFNCVMGGLEVALGTDNLKTDVYGVFYFVYHGDRQEAIAVSMWYHKVSQNGAKKVPTHMVSQDGESCFHA